MSYSMIICSLLEDPHTFLNLFYQMKFIVDSVYLFLALPIHFRNLSIRLGINFTNFARNFRLNLQSVLYIFQLLSIFEAVQVSLKLSFYRLDTHSF